MAGETNFTNCFWTETSSGPVEHKLHRGLHCPVKLQTLEHTDADGNAGRKLKVGANGWPMPVRGADGAMVYALPGGGEFHG